MVWLYYWCFFCFCFVPPSINPLSICYVCIVCCAAAVACLVRVGGDGWEAERPLFPLVHTPVAIRTLVAYNRVHKTAEHACNRERGGERVCVCVRAVWTESSPCVAYDSPSDFSLSSISCSLDSLSTDATLNDKALDTHISNALDTVLLSPLLHSSFRCRSLLHLRIDLRSSSSRAIIRMVPVCAAAVRSILQWYWKDVSTSFVSWSPVFHRQHRNISRESRQHSQANHST